jgi:hypothetical protein
MTDYKQRKKGSVVAQTAGLMRNDLPKLTPQEEHEAAAQGIAEEERLFPVPGMITN